jgi:hypothetical protein
MTQPGVSTPGTGYTSRRRALKGHKNARDNNIKRECIVNMSRSLALVLVHIIFSTKNRMCHPLRVGGVNDHGAFSVSQSARESVFLYIVNQEMHHRRINFQDEFRALLDKHGVRFEERYLWD